jgi:hypothetical protein
MWPKITMLALVAGLLPLGAFAQSNDAGGGPPPDVAAKLDAARTDAKTASLAALGDDHRAKAQAIVDAFDATGSTLTIAAASSQIDAVLDKDESQAVLEQEQKMRDAMRAAFADSGGPPGGGNGGRGGGRGGFGGRRHAPDAGRFLLSVDATQDRYREAMRAERGP